MKRPLPPLNGLRAFEVAARHLNMSRAADELHVTPAAISHQIKTLESFLGVKLIVRRQRGFDLTPLGESYLVGLRDGFSRIVQATDAVYAAAGHDSLTISVSPTIGAKWLLPRIERFSRRHPEIEVLVSASDGLVDFNRTQSDVGIRYGSGRYPGLRSDKLFDEEVFPVCSPLLLEGEHPIREPADLLHHTLLHGPPSSEPDETFPTWEMWLKSCGVDTGRLVMGPEMSPHWMVLEAAAAGQGVALAKSTAVADDLRRRRLVRLFDTSRRVSFAYYLVCLEEKAELEKIQLFRAWLIEQARETEADRRQDANGGADEPPDPSNTQDLKRA